MWNVTSIEKCDWRALKEKITKHGVRNSLLLAPMPMTSTAQVLGNNESVEPYTSNVYSHCILSVEFQVINNHLMKDLVDAGLWNNKLKNEIGANEGSVQVSDVIPSDLQALYKTVWGFSQKTVTNTAADRDAFINQSHSLNNHVVEPNYAKLTPMHF